MKAAVKSDTVVIKANFSEFALILSDLKMAEIEFPNERRKKIIEALDNSK